jgi:hypothetical protein
MELILRTTDAGGINGPQVGKLLTDTNDRVLTAIRYNSVPELQNAVFSSIYLSNPF